MDNLPIIHSLQYAFYGFNEFMLRRYVGKPVLSPMSADLIFHLEHKATGINYIISQSQSARHEWSGFAAFPSPVAVRMCGVGP